MTVSATPPARRHWFWHALWGGLAVIGLLVTIAGGYAGYEYWGGNAKAQQEVAALRARIVAQETKAQQDAVAKRDKQIGDLQAQIADLKKLASATTETPDNTAVSATPQDDTQGDSQIADLQAQVDHLKAAAEKKKHHQPFRKTTRLAQAAPAEDRRSDRAARTASEQHQLDGVPENWHVAHFDAARANTCPSGHIVLSKHYTINPDGTHRYKNECAP